MKSLRVQLVVAFLVAVAALLGYGIWYAAIGRMSNSAANLEHQIRAKTRSESRIASERAMLADIKGDEAAVQGYFVPEGGVVAFINDLEVRGEAQEATVKVLSVSTLNTGSHPALTLLLSVKGKFDAVMRTVGAIEYAPYNIAVGTLSLTQDVKDSWHASVGLVVGSASTTKNTP